MASRKSLPSIKKGTSPFKPNSRAAEIDYAITNKVRNVYSKLFGMKFEPLANQKPQNDVEEYSRQNTSNQIKKISEQVGEMKSILTEMSNTLKEIKKSIEDGNGGSGILDILRNIIPGGRGGGGRTPTAAPVSPGNSLNLTNASAQEFGGSLNEFLSGSNESNNLGNSIHDELEKIRKKLFDENTISVKFSKTSDSSEQLENISQNIENISKNIEGSIQKQNEIDYHQADNTNASKESGQGKFWGYEVPSQIKNDMVKQIEKYEGSPEPKNGIQRVLPQFEARDQSTTIIPQPKHPTQILPISPSEDYGKVEIKPTKLYDTKQNTIEEIPQDSMPTTDKAEKMKADRKSDLTKRSEGFVEKIKDGHIGYGHKLTPDELKSGQIKLKDGSTIDINKGITREQADQLYEEDYQKHSKAASDTLSKLGVDTSKLPEGTRQAVEDLAYNAGPGIFKKAPKLVDALRRNDMEAAAKEIESTATTSKGKTLAGLETRAAERAKMIREDLPIMEKTSAEVSPLKRQIGPVLENMETQLENNKDAKDTTASAPTIINNTTNNTTAGNMSQGPIAPIRNDESSIVRMQNMIAAGALS